MAEFDLVIRGGTIVDGSGEAAFPGDVAVKDGVIAAVGSIEGRGEEEIDAGGRLVTPGFVDVHTHYDGQAIWSKELSPSSSHGVTTVVVGNCGVGFAPCRREDQMLLVDVMEGVEDIPGVVMVEGLSWDWETFPQYLDALEARERDIDVACLLPHSPLRVYAMGERGARREAANDDDLARMRGIAREAIEAGALGFASSRLSIHLTASGSQIPSYEAPMAEIVEIARGMADAGSGTLQMVLDAPVHAWGEETDRIVSIAEASGRPTTFSLIPQNTGPPAYREALARIEAANARGIRVTGQVLPRPIGVLSGLSLTINPFVLCPSYKAIEHLPLDEKVERLKDPELRARLLVEQPDEGHPLAVMSRSWNWLYPMGDPPNYLPAREDSVGARAREAGITPEECAYELMLQNDGKTIFYGAFGNFYQGRTDATEELLNHPHCILGLGDGGAHYGTVCDASFPTFFLTQWSRDRSEGRIPVEQAIHMLTRKPAEALGLGDRGLIAPGKKADLNVLDLQRMRLHAPYVVADLPAGGRRLDQTADGYDATIVSGHVIRRFDRSTGIHPGQLVRGAR